MAEAADVQPSNMEQILKHLEGNISAIHVAWSQGNATGACNK